MTSRRNFIKKMAAGTAAMTVGGVLPGFSAKSYNNIVGANEKIKLAAIGVNSRGNAVASGFAKESGCEISHICDVDSRAIAKCIKDIIKIAGNTPKGEKDIRKLLEIKDIDGVIIATPEHWHAPGALMAMKAGKHVYLEKPTAHNPAENHILMQAIKKYKVVVATGMQRRSWPNVRKAIQEVQGGAIGKVYFGKAWYVNNRAPIGIGKPTAVPSWLDWELWQGPAPRVKEYKDNFLHYKWHWFYHWGTGEAGNNAVHFIDLLRWGMGLIYPTEINSMGGRFAYKDDWEFPDTQIINLKFDNDKMITWEGRSCNRRHIEDASVGCIFHGELGSLVVGTGNDYRIYDEKNKLIKDVKSDIEFRQGDTRNPSQKLDAFHFSNFLDGIRKDIPLYADINEGAISTDLSLLANISLRTQSTLKINPLNGKILQNKKANKLWSRKYEKGWEMKI